MKLISRILQNENSTDSSPKEYFARIPEITTPLTVHRSTEVYSSITVTSELSITRGYLNIQALSGRALHIY